MPKVRRWTEELQAASRPANSPPTTITIINLAFQNLIAGETEGGAAGGPRRRGAIFVGPSLFEAYPVIAVQQNITMVTFGQLCDRYEVDENFVRKLIDFDLLSPLYEDEGVLFPAEAELRLQVILKAGKLGFSLAEIYQLVTQRRFDNDGAYG